MTYGAREVIYRALGAVHPVCGATFGVSAFVYRAEGFISGPRAFV